MGGGLKLKSGTLIGGTTAGNAKILPHPIYLRFHMRGLDMRTWRKGTALLSGLMPEVALVVKNPPANAGDERDVGSIPWSGRSPGEGNGNPRWYSCLENSMTDES